jgi:hypothetical protein
MPVGVVEGWMRFGRGVDGFLGAARAVGVGGFGGRDGVKLLFLLDRCGSG